MTTAKFLVGFSLTFIPGRTGDHDFSDLLSRFYDELLAIEDRCPEVADPDIAASLTEFQVEVMMTVEAESLIDAQVTAITVGRTALHTIEVGTPGWEAVIAGIAAPCPAEEDLLDA